MLRHPTAVLMVVLAALAVRLAASFALDHHRFASTTGPAALSEVQYLRQGVVDLSDSDQYLLLARNLRSRQIFTWDTAPVTFRTPGYPLLLALLGGRATLLVVVQSLLGALSVLLVFLIGRRLFDERSGLLAAGLLALDIPNVLYTGLVMAEALLVFLLLLAVWLFVRARSVLSGLGFGLAALVKPVALLAFIPFAMALAVRHRWRPLVIFIAASLVLPGIWTARNFAHYRRMAYTSLSGANLLYTYAGALVADQRGITTDQARVELSQEYGVGITSDNPLEVAARLASAGTRVIMQDPLRYAWVCLRGVVWIILGPKSDDLIGNIARPGQDGISIHALSDVARLPAPARVAARLLVAIELLLTLGALGLAVVSAARPRTRSVGILLLGIAAYFLLAGSPLTDGRLRIPAMPFVFIAAAGVLWRPGPTDRGASPQAGSPRSRPA